MPNFFIFNDLILPMYKPFHLMKLASKKIFDKKGIVKKCFICGGVLTEDTTAVIGTVMIHNHVRICEAVTYKRKVIDNENKSAME